MNPSRLRSFALAPTLLCALAAADIPSITALPTNANHPGKVVWVDLLTDDVDRARKFYGEVFGWSFETSIDDDYVQITNAGRPIAGMAPYPDGDKHEGEALWLVSFSVENVNVAVESVEKRGGQVVEAATDLPDRGRIAVVRDDQGAVAMLLRAAQGDPLDTPTETNDFFWAELWTHDPGDAAKFYASVFGYDVHTVGDYIVLASDGKPRAGVVDLPWKDIESNWLPYIRVENAVDTAKRALLNGGRIVVSPDDEAGRDRVMILADPTGGVFAIQQREES